MILLVVLALLVRLLIGALFYRENMETKRRKVFEDFLNRNSDTLSEMFLNDIEKIHGLPVWEVKDLLRKYGYMEVLIGHTLFWEKPDKMGDYK